MTTLCSALRHEEVDRSELVSIQGAFRVELLRPGAARAFEQMRRAAKRDGVHLYLVSGFRSIQHQEDLYFGVKAQRVQSSRERAMVSGESVSQPSLSATPACRSAPHRSARQASQPASIFSSRDRQQATSAPSLASSFSSPFSFSRAEVLSLPVCRRH